MTDAVAGRPDRAPSSRSTAGLATLAARPLGTAVLAAGLFVVYFVTAGWGSLSADVIATSLPSWALGQHHTADLDGFQNATPLWVTVVDGHWRSDRFPGAILLAVPAYWLFGDPAAPHVGPAAATAAAAAALSVALMHRTLLRVVAPGLALAAALVFGLGTATWSVSADALWTHTATQLGLCTVLFGIASGRPWLSGLGMTLSAAARPHTTVAAAAIGVGDFVRTRRVETAAWLAAGGLAGFAVVLFWTSRTLGGATLFPGSYSGRGNDVVTPGGASGGDGWPLNVAGFLFSPERGLLVLCPFVALCLAGLFLRDREGRRAWGSAPGWVKDAGYGAAAYAVVQLAVNHFAGGWGFYSFRLGIESLTLLTPLLVVGAAALVTRTAWAWSLAALVGYSLAVHALGAIWYVNVNEGPVWWRTYQPAQLAADVPWHAVAAALLAVGAVGLLAALVRDDDGRPPVLAPPRAQVEEAV